MFIKYQSEIFLGFSEFLWLYGKLKESIKDGQATMNSENSPTKSPEMLAPSNQQDWQSPISGRNIISTNFGILGSSPPESEEGSLQ